MKIRMFLFVSPELATKARFRWQELGGSDTVIQPGDDAIQLTFIAEDRESLDGQRLAVLAKDLEHLQKVQYV